MKRLFDIFFSLVSLLLLSPFLILIALIVAVTSRGGVFFRGERVGQYGRPFKIYKFRSMIKDAEGSGNWNVGDNDSRITPFGHFLRKTKIDELPQLINVLLGDMTFVGPRPELQYYVNYYTEREECILELKPGITDWASLTNYDQFKVFTKVANPDETYMKYIRPLKIQLELYYRNHRSLKDDIKIIFWTVYKLITHTKKIPKEIEHIVTAYSAQVSDETMKEKGMLKDDK